MFQVKYSKFIKELHDGLNEAAEEMPEIDPSDMAYEVASNALIDEAWIKPYLTRIGVTDLQGRLADDIYSGQA